VAECSCAVDQHWPHGCQVGSMGRPLSRRCLRRCPRGTRPAPFAPGLVWVSECSVGAQCPVRALSPRVRFNSV